MVFKFTGTAPSQHAFASNCLSQNRDARRDHHHTKNEAPDASVRGRGELGY